MRHLVPGALHHVLNNVMKLTVVPASFPTGGQVGFVCRQASASHLLIFHNHLLGRLGRGTPKPLRSRRKGRWWIDIRFLPGIKMLLFIVQRPHHQLRHPLFIPLIYADRVAS